MTRGMIMNKGIVAIMALVAMPALGQETAAAAGWTGDVALGYTRKSGNTQSSAASVDVKALLDQGEWKHTATAEYDFESQDKQTTEDDFYASWKSDYRIDARAYLYGFGAFKDDRYSGVDGEVALSAGYGRVLLDDGVFQLAVEGGPGYRITNPTQGDVRHDAIARFGEQFSWKLSDTATFRQELAVESGGGNTSSKFMAALETAVVENIALRLAYHAEHIHRVPDDRHRTDTKVVVSLVYKFD